MVMPIAFALPCLQGAFSAETLREKVGGVTIGLAGIDWLGIDDCGDWFGVGAVSRHYCR